jgi:pimeloyl-ACP methyl ester carboxylesterase
MTHRSATIAAALLLLFCVGGRRAAASPLPAKTGFVTVNDIKLYYLDWGGSGATILFLPGFNDAAHVYDDFAPRFTDRFHVIGLTRRGVGESDKPKSGYDTSTRVEDIREFLDALGVQTVIIIGHSMAGDEPTLFATRYPQRVAKIVYLDAAYDRTPEGWLAGLTDPTNRPGMMQRRARGQGRLQKCEPAQGHSLMSATTQNGKTTSVSTRRKRRSKKEKPPSSLG